MKLNKIIIRSNRVLGPKYWLNPKLGQKIGLTAVANPKLGPKIGLTVVANPRKRINISYLVIIMTYYPFQSLIGAYGTESMA